MERNFFIVPCLLVQKFYLELYIGLDVLEFANCIPAGLKIFIEFRS